MRGQSVSYQYPNGPDWAYALSKYRICYELTPLLSGAELKPGLAPLQALPWKDEIVAVGLARGIPNFKGEKHQHAEFKDVIERCRGLGWQITAHVGEPAEPAAMCRAQRPG